VQKRSSKVARQLLPPMQLDADVCTQVWYLRKRLKINFLFDKIEYIFLKFSLTFLVNLLKILNFN
jgi:hypothetical protein